MPDPRVTLDPSIAHNFRLEAWDVLDDGGKRALGDDLSERLQARGWDVPEPMALRPDSLFYWGDDLPEFMTMDLGPPSRRTDADLAARPAAFDAVMSASFAPDRPRDWPWCNRSGLAAMLPLLTWCARSTVPGDPSPFIARGGAAFCCPWRGCGEWELLLNAVESRVEEDADCTIRPIFRLEVGA